MEIGKSEFHEPELGNRESGYSEAEQALDIEVRAGEWKQLKKQTAFQQRNRQGKIVALYQAVSHKLTMLIVEYCQYLTETEVAENPALQEKTLTELKKLRMIQDILLNSALWECEGTLEKSMIPGEVWEMIE